MDNERLEFLFFIIHYPFYIIRFISRVAKNLKFTVLFVCVGQILIFSAAQFCFGQNQTTGTILTLDEAVKLAVRQASNYKAAQINEQIAAEDIRQARAAFYPRVALAPNVILTTPSLGKTVTAGVTDGNLTAITSRPPSFLGANAVSEFQGLITTTGEIDTSGRLNATLRRSRLLLESARLGSEIARRELVQSVADTYFNLALATTKKRGAASNLQAANEFENNIKLQLDAGEVAPVDLVRARLQTAQRRDELAQNESDETIAADALRFLVGYGFTQNIIVEDLLTQMPNAGEIETFAETAIKTRPEFAQFEADRKAADLDVKIAQTERRPQFNYSVSTGFISDSLFPNSVKNGLGAQVSVGVNLPLFDKGASRSRETQARLRLQQAENTRALAERQFVQAFYAARTQAISAASRIRQIAASITDAEKNVSASLARYQAGEASIIEITDAQNLLIALRQSLYQAIFDYQTARARLLRASGQ